MPVYLKLSGDVLTCKISGIKDKVEFNDTLERVKNAVRGRRYNPETKLWEFPATPDNALRIMAAVEPVADAAVQSMVRDHQLETAESIVSAIPDDAALVSPMGEILFPYQRAFVDWTLDHPHCILADDMGVGKSIQGIAAVKVRDLVDPDFHDQGDALVICPNGLRRNYRAEIIHGPRDKDGVPIYDDWPSSTVQILDGANIGKRKAQLASGAEWFVTNWEKLRTDADLLRKHPWRAVVASEAHRAKNRKAKQTRGLWKLRAPVQIAETGTPIMNSPGELWPLLAWLFPEQYAGTERGGGYWPFHNNYVDDYPTKQGRVMRGIKNVDELRFELQGRMVHRKKFDVLKDLPRPLPPKVIEVELNSSERRLYAEAETALYLDAANFARKRAEEELGTPETDLLPSQVDVLRKRVEEIGEELAAMPLERLQGLIPNGAARVAALRQITARAKAREAVELVRDNPTNPFVIFTWYVEPAQWVAQQLEADKLNVGLIAGSGGDPTETAQAFQRGEHDHVVATIAKGGQGLDLYRSSAPIFADEDWVPSINQQALDRLVRQGQEQVVTPIILRVPDTVDTGRVAPAIEFKRAIVTRLMG